MERMKITKIISREWDGLQTITTVKMSDGTQEAHGGNPLTWHYCGLPEVSKAVWDAYTLDLIRRVQENKRSSDQIRAFFGIRDQYHPEPYD